jgi:hypothetical protein
LQLKSYKLRKRATVLSLHPVTSSFIRNFDSIFEFSACAKHVENLPTVVSLFVL